MAKGKYAAKAINRAAALDNDVIAELRAQLKVAQGRITELTDEVKAKTSATNSDIMRRAGELACAEVDRMSVELQMQSQNHQKHIEALAFDLLDLYTEHGCVTASYGDVDAFNIEFARLFGLSDRAGELVDYIKAARNDSIGNQPTNRYLRRFTATAKKMRRADAALRDLHRNPRAFGLHTGAGYSIGNRVVGPNTELPR